ncbi:MAG: type II secretion system F family protein [Candidatus Curtissbacteria bacterium]|nr:type II secretion system F family protein [Candidatus Curtissbacteria bacterium]
MSVTLSKKDKLMLISNLGTMLTAGIPILEAVESLASDSKGNQKKIIETLHADLNQGRTISSSFAKFPKAFDPVTVNLVKAAEESGTLDSSLKDLTVGIKKDMEFTEKVKGAITYPVFVIIVFVGVLLLILTFVIPRISSVFSRLNVDLPLPTRILINFSDLLLGKTIPVIAVLAVLVVGIVFLYKTRKKTLLNVILSLPILKRLARDIDLTRFCRSMSLLLTSGIPITEALDLSSNVVTKKEVSRAIETAKKFVAAGRKLSESFKENSKVIPSIMIRITEAGERSGTLEKSMQDISEYFEGEVTRRLRTLTSLLEPLMLVFIGLLVGGMMLAIIAPIYGLIGNIGAR